jgi:hypothetical protein
MLFSLKTNFSIVLLSIYSSEDSSPLFPLVPLYFSTVAWPSF